MVVSPIPCEMHVGSRMAVIRLGGVPEHYNAPVHTTLAAVAGEQYEWVSHPSGTGAMLEALERGELDMAIILTEGAVKHAVATGLTKLIGTYVDNPLPWGVHVRPGGSIASMADMNARLPELTFGISRFGSGSHLMAIVHASTCGVQPPTFKVVNTMAGARHAMVNGEIDVFLWDITTADVYAKEGAWTCIGEVSGDWPAFVFAVRSDIDKLTLGGIRQFILNLATHCGAMKSGGAQSVDHLCAQYGITSKQAGEFIERIKWNCTLSVDRSALERVTQSLQDSGVLPKADVDVDTVTTLSHSHIPSYA